MSIAIRLPPELDKRLTVLAKKTHRSKSYYAREAIERHIEDLEDYYLAKSVQENPGPVYSIEEVEKMCGLED
jgi:RHH-type rel operon transcriptional repressor/antitoxin RelB